MFVNSFGHLDCQYKLFLLSIKLSRTKIVFGLIIQSKLLNVSHKIQKNVGKRTSTKSEDEH